MQEQIVSNLQSFNMRAKTRRGLKPLALVAIGAYNINKVLDVKMTVQYIILELLPNSK